RLLDDVEVGPTQAHVDHGWVIAELACHFEVGYVDDPTRYHRGPAEAALFQHFHRDDHRFGSDPVDRCAAKAVPDDRARDMRAVGVLVVLPDVGLGRHGALIHGAAPALERDRKLRGDAVRWALR